MNFAIGRGGFAGIRGMLVVRRGIEFLGHVEPPSCCNNVPAIPMFRPAGA
jgi:hypothetical protein